MSISLPADRLGSENGWQGGGTADVLINLKWQEIWACGS
jgi:ubiquinone biosynthesis protein Coq4